MMAMDGQISLGSCSNLDVLRQRAQKAAQNHQHQQQFSVDHQGEDRNPTSPSPSSRTYQIMPLYSEHHKSANSILPTKYSSESGLNIDTGPPGLSSNVNRFLSETSSNVVPHSTSKLNGARMRAGIIDLRSSYNERHSGSSARLRSRTFHGPHTSSKTRTQAYDMEVKQPTISQLQKYNQQQENHPAYKTDNRDYANKTMFNRISNNMDVDSGEVDSPPPTTGKLHRKYGSTSSLEILSTSADNFFSMLTEIHQQSDQRSPAPPRLRELLQGRLVSSSEPHIQTAVESPRSGVRFMNGSAPGDKTSVDSCDTSKPNKDKSKHKERTQRARSITGEIGVSLLKGKTKYKDGKQRAKSIADENGVGILKKLRGKIDSELNKVNSEHPIVSGEDSPARSKGDSRQRAFVHFDCQSIGVDLGRIIHQRVHIKSSKNNITTGASASSDQRTGASADKDDLDLLIDTDEGDGKFNDLVLSCPSFRNEIGGEDERTVSLAKATAQKRAAGSFDSPVTSAEYRSRVRHPACCGIAVLDSSPTPSGQILPPLVTHHGHVIEYVDHGAYYYRHFFYSQDHQNYFGMDENLGPIAISVRREKLDLNDRANSQLGTDCGTAQYRIICRTSELRTLRGCVLEEAIPSRISNSRGIPIKDVLEVAVPEVQLSCLRQAVAGQKTCEQLLKLDEQGISNTYKVGIMYCKSGQATEEDMYNNENSSSALDEFLNLIGTKVKLKGFEQFRAGLDCKTDTTGTHSFYTTFNNNEIMFHVSTMLPYTVSNKQQLLRKRHIGNNIVTIVFQEPGALAFTPQTVMSQFQHVFIIVRVSNPNSENTRYSISVARSKDVPPFGPKIPENCSFRKSQEFVDFLLAKVINAENAAHKSDKFLTMATRTREEYLKDLANNYVTSTPVDSGSKLSKFGLGSGRKKDKSRKKVGPDMFAKGALVWNVQLEDMGSASQVECLLAIASDTIVLVEQTVKDVIFTVPCSSVIGWTPQPSSLRLYFGAGECIVFRPLSGAPEETQEIITRLQACTNGTETSKLALKRNGLGQLGFHIQPDGIVLDVEPYGYAWEAGLRKGSRLVEICKVATITLSHDQILDILRTSATVKVVVVSPLEDGSPRGISSVNNNLNVGKTSPSSEPYSLHHHHHQQSQPQPGLKSSLKCSGGVSHDYSDSTGSSGKSFNDARSSYFGYSRQELADMYRSLHSSQDGVSGSEDELHSRNNTYDSPSYSTQGISSRSQSGQLNQRSVLRGERFIGSPDSSMDSSIYGSTSTQGSGASRHFANMEYMSGIPATGQISLDLLKQIQNKKYSIGKSQWSSSSQDSQKQSQGGGGRSGSATNFNLNFEGSAGRTSYHAQRNDLNVLSKEESTQTNNLNDCRATKPVLTKGITEPLTGSPRATKRNLYGQSSEESLVRGYRQKPTGQTSKDFQKDLQRLIDLNLSENDLVGYSSRGQSSHKSGPLQVTLSDDSLHSSKELNNEKALVRVNGFACERPSPRTRFDLTSSGQRKRDSGLQQQLLFRKRSDSYDRPEEGRHSHDSLQPRPLSPQMNIGPSSSPSSVATSSVPTSDNSEQRIQELQQRLGKMSQELDKTQQKNSAMVTEMQHLRADNVRLQEESQTAATQLRQFSEWFFKSIYQK